MRILHTADLHIGKSIYEFNMLEDQRYILKQILKIAEKEQVDAIVLAGDIYDRSVPSTEAVQLLEWFLMEALSVCKVFMISGNHDSAERLGFGASLMEHSGLYIAGGEHIKEYLFEEEKGSTAVHLLPFVKPAVVGTESSEEAVRKQLEGFKDNWGAADRHILITHFFVCASGKEPELSDSEQAGFVGGLDQVDASLFADYDYVALGHIHKPQCMKREQVYYAGSPLAYSFSECGKVIDLTEQKLEEALEITYSKSVNIVDIPIRDKVTVTQRVLRPLRNMCMIKGSLKELLEQGAKVTMEKEKEPDEEWQGKSPVLHKMDYIQAILTDRGELIDPMESLRSVYPNVMQIVLEKRLEEGSMPMLQGAAKSARSMEELFRSFYEALTGEAMDEARSKVVKEITIEVEGGL